MTACSRPFFALFSSLNIEYGCLVHRISSDASACGVQPLQKFKCLNSFYCAINKPNSSWFLCDEIHSLLHLRFQSASRSLYRLDNTKYKAAKLARIQTTTMLNYRVRNAILFAFAGFLLGCLIRDQRCQNVWNERHPYIFTGTEQLDDLSKRISSASAIIPFSVPGATTVNPPRTFERPPTQRYQKPSEKGKVASKSTDSGSHQSVSKVRPATTPFPDDPPSGFRILAVNWRRDHYPGKAFANVTNRLKELTSGIKTKASTMLAVPTSKPFEEFQPFEDSKPSEDLKSSDDSKRSENSQLSKSFESQYQPSSTSSSNSTK